MSRHVNRHDHDRNFSDDLYYWTGNQYGNALDSNWNEGYPEDENLVAPHERTYVGKGPKGYKRPDESIKEDIVKHLYHSIDIDARDIELEVKNNRVTLRGSVPYKDMKTYAELLCMGVSGVEYIYNEIKVKPTS